MTRPRVPAPAVHVGPPAIHYDPVDEADFRRQVQDAFEVVEGRARVDEAGPPKGAGFVREVPTETASVATLTLTPIDGAEFDEVQSSTQRGNASWGAWTPLTADGSGNYVDTVDLVEKHNSKIAYRVYVNGVIAQENVVTFDFGTTSEVTNLVVSYDGAGVATVTAKFDSDTATGVSGAEYSLNAGTSWTALTVASDRTASFMVAQSTSAVQTALVRGFNSAATAGESVPIEIEKLVEPARFTTADMSALDNGTDVIFTMVWETPDGVGTGPYSITCRIHELTSGFVAEYTGLGPASGNSVQGTGNGLGNGIANNSYYAEFFLVATVGTNVYDYRRSVPRIEAI